MVANVRLVFLGHVFVVDGQDDVALFQSHFGSGHVLVGLFYDDAFKLTVVFDDGTDTSVFTRNHEFKVFHLVFGIVHGVRVQGFKHGIDARSHRLVSVKRVYIHHIEVFVDSVKNVKVLGHVEVVVSIVLRHCCTGGGG